MSDEVSKDSKGIIVFLGCVLGLVGVLVGSLGAIEYYNLTPQAEMRDQCSSLYGTDRNGDDEWMIERKNGSFVCIPHSRFKERILVFLMENNGSWEGSYQELSMYIGYESFQEWRDYKGLEEMITDMEQEEILICSGNLRCEILDTDLKEKLNRVGEED